MTSALSQFDVIILGGGLGLRIATACARAGLATALIEKGTLGGGETLGGASIRRTLIAAIEEAETSHRKAGRQDGLSPIAAHHALNRAFGKGLSTARRLESGIDSKINVFWGEAAFRANDRIVVNGHELRAEKIVIATGSLPHRPDGIFKGLPITTPDDLATFDEAPRTITILGGGPAASFFTHVFERLGSDVVQIHRGPQLLAWHDPDLSEAFTRSFKNRHRVMTNTVVTAASHDGRRFRLALQRDGETLSRYSEKVVLAVGRRPATEALFLDRAGVITANDGGIVVDHRGRTNVPGIFAVGDVTAGCGRFANGPALADRLARQLIDPKTAMPDISEPEIFALPILPEAAAVGTVDPSADVGSTLVARLPWPDPADDPKDVSMFKLVADRAGMILGAHAVGNGAVDAVALIAVAMRSRESVADLASLAAPEKSRAEILVAAAREILRQIG